MPTAAEAIAIRTAESLWRAIGLNERTVLQVVGEAIGYGRVMQLASELWNEKHPQGGALTVGPCTSFMVDCPHPDVTHPPFSSCDWCCGSGKVTQRVLKAMGYVTLQGYVPASPAERLPGERIETTWPTPADVAAIAEGGDRLVVLIMPRDVGKGPHTPRGPSTVMNRADVVAEWRDGRFQVVKDKDVR